MNISDLEQTVKTERSAERYLRRFCGRPERLSCPECGHGRLYRIEKGKRLRCASCRYSFRLLTGRWMDRVKIGLHDWLWTVKLFELETPATVISVETGISYPTVLKAVDTIRLSIADSSGSSPAGLPSGSPEGRFPQVFGITSADDGGAAGRAIGRGELFYVSSIGECLLVMTSRDNRFASVRLAGRRVPLVDGGAHFPFRRVYCDCRGFWPLMKERLAKHHGVSDRKLPLYLKEGEFRWTHRGSSIFEELVRALCRPTPKTRRRSKAEALAV